MEIDAFLCDHAEVADGKLFINGAGVTTSWSAPQPPHMLSIAVAIVVQVEWTATNEPHELTVSLVDGDGAAVRGWTPDGSESGPVELRTGFTVGRPPQLPAGESQAVPLAFGFTVPLPRLGMHEFVIAIDGEPAKRLPIRAMTQS
jgi:hypothetical protein